MGWFDEQIKQRKQNDDAVFAEAFVGMADAVLGTKMSAAYSTDEAKAEDAIGQILKYYKVKPREVPDSVKGLNDRLEYLLRPHGIMRRNVKLEKRWYKDSIGAILGKRKDDGSVVAFIPKGLSGYVYSDPSTGKWVRLNRRNEALFEDEGICFYKPFPLKKLSVPALLKYIAGILSGADIALVILATLAVSAVGLLSPKLNNLLMGAVVQSKEMRLLLGITVFMVSVTISSLLLGAVKSLVTDRVNTKLELSVQAATMMRILSLP
ncbi:MAG: NHLP family bacteriocin export ABC transporter permease/ATPase subunit, partial [Ruminococcaceae bacterium]|nr:NHLP family bacteriocin export ABC transporter permease/ATPase subunit [Oscillospiraceae bacterium]